jgi:hypothetical protein
MIIERVPTANSIHDIKLIGENDLERQFIKQLAEAGTLSCQNRQVSDSVLFRAISVASEISSYTSNTSYIAQYNFEVIQNADFTVDLTFESNDVALDLTQFTAIKLQVKHSKSAPAIIDLAIGSGLEISGDDSNVLKVTMTAAQTKLLTCETYYYDVLTTKTAISKYYLEGKITTIKTGTR